MNVKVQVLRKVSVFASLGEAHLKEIAGITNVKTYRKNEVVFHQGDPGSLLFILKSGVAKISMIDANNKEYILKTVYENDFFGEMSLLDGHFRSATVTAVKDIEALMLFREDFTRLIRKNPAVVLDMVAVMSRRLRKADESIASLTFFDAYGKVSRLLLDLAAREGEPKGDRIVLTPVLSRQEMANMAGLSRETFTRVLTEFEVGGRIQVEKKKIIILDIFALKKEVI